MWYYLRNGERVGPIDQSTMSALIASGNVFRNTPVWKEGMSDWQEAATTELASLFASVPPAGPSPYGPAAYAPVAGHYPPESFRTLWLWMAWLLGAGTPAIIICIGLFAVIAGVVITYVLLYRYWSVIQDGRVRTSPGKAVGFCFIPFFNIYWVYVAWVGLAKDINAYCRARSIYAPRVDEGLALTFYILLLVSAIPYLGLLIALVNLVILIILNKQLSDAAASIAAAKLTSAGA